MMKGSDKRRLNAKIQKVNPAGILNLVNEALTEESRFAEWMQRVDAEIERAAGVSIHDLPDQDFRGAFEDGVSAKSFATQVLLEEGGF